MAALSEPGIRPLFEPGFLGQLERLRLVTRHSVSGQHGGDRRSVRRGQSVEFADYRSYAPGDDFRRVDWNAYARLERLFLKLFIEEQETALHLLVDASASMDWGGEVTKFRQACRLAGALGYVALAGYDRVGVGLLRGDLAAWLGPLRGRAATWRLWDHLARAEAGGAADLGRALNRFCARQPAPGVALVISDCLMPLDFLAGLGALQAARQEVALVQILAPDELAPDLEGDLRLVDRESRGAQEVAVNARLLADYARRLAEHTGAIADWCSRRGIRFLQLDSTLPLEQVVLQGLRGAGVVE